MSDDGHCYQPQVVIHRRSIPADHHSGRVKEVTRKVMGVVACLLCSMGAF